MLPTDARLRAQFDRLAALQREADGLLLQTALALSASGRTLQSARALLALPLVRADELDRRLRTAAQL